MASRQRRKKKKSGREDNFTPTQKKAERTYQASNFGYILDKLSAMQGLGFIRCILSFVRLNIIGCNFFAESVLLNTLLISPIKVLFLFTAFILYLLGKTVHSIFCPALKHCLLCDECHHSNLVLIFWVGNIMNQLNKYLIPQTEINRNGGISVFLSFIQQTGFGPMVESWRVKVKIKTIIFLR